MNDTSRTNPRSYIAAGEITGRSSEYIRQKSLMNIGGVGPIPMDYLALRESITTKEGDIFSRECDLFSCIYSNSAGDKKFAPPTWLKDYWDK